MAGRGRRHVPVDDLHAGAPVTPSHTAAWLSSFSSVASAHACAGLAVTEVLGVWHLLRAGLPPQPGGTPLPPLSVSLCPLLSLARARATFFLHAAGQPVDSAA